MSVARTGEGGRMANEEGRIVVAGLTKTYGTLRAVDGLSFTVEPGTITGFLGPNGAGKTTTLRMLLGLITSDAGTATISGHPYRALPAPNDQVGAVLEASGFHPARSGHKPPRIYGTVNGYPPQRRPPRGASPSPPPRAAPHPPPVPDPVSVPPPGRADQALDWAALADAGRR